jgi:hypothetical protein
MSMYKLYQYYKIINDVPSIHAIMSTIDNFYIIHLQVKLKLVVVVLSCESSNYFSFQSNWYTAIVLSMFMLHSFLWYMIYVIFLSGSEFVHYFFWVETNLCILLLSYLYIYTAVGDPVIRRVWDPINRLNHVPSQDLNFEYHIFCPVS